MLNFIINLDIKIFNFKKKKKTTDSECVDFESSNGLFGIG